MKFKHVVITGILTTVICSNVLAAEYEQITAGPVQSFTQKTEDASYTIFKFSLSGGISNSTSSIFAAGTSSVSECVGFSKTEKAVSTVETHCTSSDSLGNTLVGASARSGAVGQTSSGKQTVEIQSGPNAGAKAECSFIPKYLKGADGTYLVVASKCKTEK